VLHLTVSELKAQAVFWAKEWNKLLKGSFKWMFWETYCKQGMHWYRYRPILLAWPLSASSLGQASLLGCDRLHHSRFRFDGSLANLCTYHKTVNTTEKLGLAGIRP
jgi:hypothetical protein